MSATPWHGRLLSLEDWDALPEDDSRQCELVEGVIEASAKPIFGHQRAMFELGFQLRDQLPDELSFQLDSEVLIRTLPPTVRAPDLIVLPRAVASPDLARCHATDVLLAVEIVSPSSKRSDTEVKFEEYAEAGIPNYWIIDTEPPVSLTSYRLVEDEYKLDFDGAGTIELHQPTRVTLRLAELQG